MEKIEEMKACDSFTIGDACAMVETIRAPATEEEREADEDGNGDIECEEEEDDEGE